MHVYNVYTQRDVVCTYWIILVPIYLICAQSSHLTESLHGFCPETLKSFPAKVDREKKCFQSFTALTARPVKSVNKIMASASKALSHHRLAWRVQAETFAKEV
jgi:hypothetical protein